MSEDEETEEGYGKVKKKVVDININVDKQGQAQKKVTSEDAEQVAKELSAITGEDISPAVTIGEYNKQKNRLRVEIASEIGERRSERSRKKALERTSFPRATGTARLTGDQASGGDFSGVTGDLRRMEFDSYEDMIQTLRELEKEGDKEATRYLGQLYKKAIKEGGRKHMKATFVGKVTDLLKEPNPKSQDEPAKEEVKEKIEEEKAKWVEEDD